MSQDTISLLERGRAGGMALHTLRRIAAALDARLRLELLWRGGELDRLVDERHAALVGALAALLAQAGWQVRPEVSYAHFGERGSIDLLGWHERKRVLLPCEAKSILTSSEEMMRRHDQKVRLGPVIAAERFGWRAAAVGRLLVLADERTNRRRVERHAAILDPVYPARGWAVRRWLRDPHPPFAGLLFLSPTSRARSGQASDTPRRVMRPRCGADRARELGA